jgi:hypothetical protein
MPGQPFANESRNAGFLTPVGCHTWKMFATRAVGALLLSLGLAKLVRRMLQFVKPRLEQNALQCK